MLDMVERIQLNLRFDNQRELVEAIKESANSQGKSVNRYVIETLKAAMGLEAEPTAGISPDVVDKLIDTKLALAIDNLLDNKLAAVVDNLLDNKLAAVVDKKLGSQLAAVVDNLLDNKLAAVVDKKLGSQLDRSRNLHPVRSEQSPTSLLETPGTKTPFRDAKERDDYASCIADIREAFKDQSSLSQEALARICGVKGSTIKRAFERKGANLPRVKAALYLVELLPMAPGDPKKFVLKSDLIGQPVDADS